MHIFSDNLSRKSSIHNRQSNKQVFFSLEFVRILLQMEAKAVNNVSSLLQFSGHSELEYTLITLLKVPTNSKLDYCSKVLRFELGY